MNTYSFRRISPIRRWKMLSGLLAHVVALTKGKLFNPQIERITARRSAMITKVSTTAAWGEHSVTILCDANAMIRPITRIPSSTNHHHGCVTTPVTPEWQVVITLKIAAAVRFTEADGGWITSPKVRVAGLSTRITVPWITIPKIAKTCYKASEGSSAYAAAGVQQGCVRAIITPGYFDIIACDEPECRWYHVVVVWRAGNAAISRCAVVPPAATILHPVFTVSVRETRDESPTTTVRCHVTVYLRKPNKMSVLSSL